MESVMNKCLAILATIIAVVTLSACNTVEGVGKDIKKGGEAIEKAAK
jgi:entericidin B